MARARLRRGVRRPRLGRAALRALRGGCARLAVRQGVLWRILAIFAAFYADSDGTCQRLNPLTWAYADVWASQGPFRTIRQRKPWEKWPEFRRAPLGTPATLPRPVGRMRVLGRAPCGGELPRSCALRFRRPAPSRLAWGASDRPAQCRPAPRPDPGVMPPAAPRFSGATPRLPASCRLSRLAPAPRPIPA